MVDTPHLFFNKKCQQGTNLLDDNEHVDDGHGNTLPAKGDRSDHTSRVEGR